MIFLKIFVLNVSLIKNFESCLGNYNTFFTEIEKIGRCIYRRYQIWVSNKLFIQSTREKFIYSLLIDTNIKKKIGRKKLRLEL